MKEMCDTLPVIAMAVWLSLSIRISSLSVGVLVTEELVKALSSPIRLQRSSSYPFRSLNMFGVAVKETIICSPGSSKTVVRIPRDTPFFVIPVTVPPVM